MAKRRPTEPELTRGAWTSALEGVGAVVTPYVASAAQPSGMPDRIVVHRTWRGWVELKGPETRLQRNQRIQIERLDRAAPGSAFVFRFEVGSTQANWSGFVEWVDGSRLSQVVENDGRAMLEALAECGLTRAAQRVADRFARECRCRVFGHEVDASGCPLHSLEANR